MRDDQESGNGEAAQDNENIDSRGRHLTQKIIAANDWPDPTNTDKNVARHDDPREDTTQSVELAKSARYFRRCLQGIWLVAALRNPRYYAQRIPILQPRRFVYT